jgi:hypothetical protein
MNFESVGSPLCKIINTTHKTAPIVSISEKENEARYPFNELQLKGEEQFQVIPNPKTEREVIYITAPSGSGKSWWTKRYCDEYRKLYKKRPIYLFSSISEDSSIDSIKGLKRIKLSPELINEPIEAKDFTDSLVIFDDTDVISDKVIKNKVNSILNSILETGRHFNVSVCYTSHIACAGNDTKRILNEAHFTVIFPKTAGNRSLKYLLDGYLGLDKHQIAKIKSLKGRWICISKTFPRVVISEQEIYIL